MRKICSISLIFVVFLFAKIPSGKAFAPEILQDERPSVNFCLSEAPDFSVFPDMNLVFRVFDKDLFPISNLSAKDIRISENGQTPVPPLEDMQVSANALGVDFYVVIDKGNRTDQNSVKDVLNSFLRYYDQSKDQVYIYTDDKNSLTPYFTPNTGVSLAQAIADYSADRVSSYRVADGAIQGAINEIDKGTNKCQKHKFLFLILGDSTIDKEKFSEIAQRAQNDNTKLVIFHVPTENGDLSDESAYRDLAEQSGGQYVSVSNNDVIPFLNTIDTYRQSYSVKYRSISGVSGQRDITFVYQGVSLATQGNTSYTVNLLAPQVVLLTPSVIERTATQVMDEGFLYNVKTSTGSIQVVFPDQFPRAIESVALIINRPGKPELRVPVEITSSTGDTYKFTWELGDLEDVRQNELSVKAEIVDELKQPSVSLDVPVTVLTYIPLNLLAERYYLYIALGVIVILLIAMIIMWRRLKNSAVGQRITAVVQNVRKTLVGGGKRGKPLASLKIMDGPPAMIGQELKILTEAVKLGRDPQRSDMTFYTPDANSSVSGLHARIERAAGIWRIVSLSQSSETFVDNESISSNTPYPLENGRIVRLGYVAQQPVTFEFNALTASEAPIRKTDVGGTDVDYRKTDVSDATMPFPKKKPVSSKPVSQGQDDDIFNEFRDQ